jgi:hypothetical protein
MFSPPVPDTADMGAAAGIRITRSATASASISAASLGCEMRRSPAALLHDGQPPPHAHEDFRKIVEMLAVWDELPVSER